MMSTLSKIYLHEAEAASHYEKEHKNRIKKVMEILKEDQQDHTLILGKGDTTARHVFVYLHMEGVGPILFPKYVVDDDEELIEKFVNDFRSGSKMVAVCNQEIYEQFDFGIVGKIIFFNFPDNTGRVQELLEHFGPYNEVHFITTANDKEENILAVEDMIQKTVTASYEAPKFSRPESMMSWVKVKTSGPSESRTKSPEFDFENMKPNAEGKYVIPERCAGDWDGDEDYSDGYEEQQYEDSEYEYPNSWDHQ